MKRDIKFYSPMNMPLLRLKYKKISKVSRCTVEEIITKNIETGDIKEW